MPRPADTPQALAAAVLAGQRGAIARALSWLSRPHPQAFPLLNLLQPHQGHARLIGLTGAPGCGKSTLTAALAQAYRVRGKSVAIVAIDPSSPYSGGAVLGDRIRMQALAGDPGVFIRSFSNRGRSDSLTRNIHGALQVFDAAGFDVILLETVGAGQHEVSIARLAHSVVVVEAPGMGDDIQAIKAGMLEIADIIVVNKADRPGAAQTETRLKAALQLSPSPANRHLEPKICPPTAWPASAEATTSLWEPVVCRSIAVQSDGITELLAALAAHQQHLVQSGEEAGRNLRRRLSEFEDQVWQLTLTHLQAALSPAAWTKLVTELVEGRITPYNAAQYVLDCLVPPAKTDPPTREDPDALYPPSNARTTR